LSADLIHDGTKDADSIPRSSEGCCASWLDSQGPISPALLSTWYSVATTACPAFSVSADDISDIRACIKQQRVLGNDRFRAMVGKNSAAVHHSDRLTAPVCTAEVHR